MSLQQRLTLFFVLIVILPLAAAGFVVQRVIGREIGQRAVVSLRPALDATVSLYNSRTEVMSRRVGNAVGGERFSDVLAGGRRNELDAFLQQRVNDTADLDILVLLDRDGNVIGAAAKRARFVPGYETPTFAEMAAADEGAGAGFTRSPNIPLRFPGGRLAARLFGGFWLDRDVLLASGSGSNLSIVANDTVIASTAFLTRPVRIDVSYSEPFSANLGEPARAAATRLDKGVGVVASTAEAPIAASSRRVLTSLLVLLALALLGTTALAYLLARLISQPLEELAEGALAIAEGRFDHRIPVRSRDEVGQLALAFNDMTGRLSDTIGQLSGSRDQIQRAVRRVGETLRSTHDMKQMLESVINTASDAVEADVAVLWSFTPTRDELYPSIARGLDVDTLPKIKVGEGLVGFVGERAANVTIPAPSPMQSIPRFARHEPSFPVAMATPLYSQDRMVGVLTAYRTDPRKHFSEEDMEMVNFLAEQCGVAIENVLLHEEAQRLSLTDGLTGTWNRRFFQMQFRQMLATATRFDRTFSVLMLDLDYFKKVNDTFGHQRGDAILVEFAQRVTSALREVDTFARYGGEEFICLLSETDVDGAVITAEKIREGIKSRAFSEKTDEPSHLTVSIGIASYPVHGDSYRALVEAADRAMYRAKQLGRDRVAIAGPRGLDSASSG